MSSGIGEAHGQRPATYLPIGIADGIRTSASATPDKVALVEGERQLRYRDFVSRMDRVANGVLHDVGLSPGDHAAVLAPNCLEYLEIVCGLASAGLAPATINGRSSAREVAMIANDAAARVLFVHPSLEEVAREAELETVERVIVIGEEYEDWLSSSRAEPCGVHIEEWDPFCIPYTSGTTGEPNGVLLSHRSRALTFFAMAVAFGCYSSSRPGAGARAAVSRRGLRVRRGADLLRRLLRDPGPLRSRAGSPAARERAPTRSWCRATSRRYWRWGRTRSAATGRRSCAP